MCRWLKAFKLLSITIIELRFLRFLTVGAIGLVQLRDKPDQGEEVLPQKYLALNVEFKRECKISQI